MVFEIDWFERIFVVEVILVNGVIIDKLLEYFFYKVLLVGDMVCMWFFFFWVLLFFICWVVVLWLDFLVFMVKFCFFIFFFSKNVFVERFVGVIGVLVLLFFLDMVDFGVILVNWDILGFNFVFKLCMWCENGCSLFFEVFELVVGIILGWKLFLWWCFKSFFWKEFFIVVGVFRVWVWRFLERNCWWFLVSNGGFL